MTPNNESRKFAKEFAETLGWKQVGNGNFFVTPKGHKVNVTSTTSGKVESRQFTLDCDYLACYDVNANKVYLHKKKDLEIGCVTRINSKGQKFYQASVK